MTTIKQELSVLHSQDGMVDLYKLDASAFGGPVKYFSPQVHTDSTPIQWGGTAYIFCPIGIDSLEKKAINAALPQPTLVVSNVGGASAALLSLVISFGDLTGAKLTHWKTKRSYLDDGLQPDTSQFIGPEIWYLFQKTTHNNLSIQWSLSGPLDKPGLMFPIRQVLKDPGINPGIPGDGTNPIYFPGVQPYRINTVGG